MFILTEPFSHFSICAGLSLFEKIHIKRERLSLTVRLNLAYQIAQALAYLHAKSITHGCLSSINIFVEKQKATLSVIDFSSSKMGKSPSFVSWSVRALRKLAY